ncbi:MAG: CBS domain-containing protein [Deltaproteobacteria bacterium]|nr:CBS domain-containing protein [Deltaproteobacteria bacterium]
MRSHAFSTFLRARPPHVEIAETPQDSSAFETIRVVACQHGRPPAKTNGRVDAALAAARLQCQRGGWVRSALDCLKCERMAGFKMATPDAPAQVECLWVASDSIRSLMTLAEGLVTLRLDTPLSEAKGVARRNQTRHVLVAEGEDLRGVSCRCDWVDRRGTEALGSTLRGPAIAMPSGGSIGDALSIMRDRRVGSLPVVAGDIVVGIVTRGDLRRTGIDESLLGAAYCAVCGSPHGVRASPFDEALQLCLDCIERSNEPVEPEGLKATTESTENEHGGTENGL